MSQVASRLKSADEAPPAALIELADVEKSYQTGKVVYAALRGVDLRIAAGEMVAVVGPSGSCANRSRTCRGDEPGRCSLS